MKVGAEDRKKLYAAILLMVLAAYAVFSLLARPQTPAAAAAPVTTSGVRKQPVRRPASTKTAQPAEENLDPTLRLSMLNASEGVKYEGTGRNIFRSQADEPAKPAVTPMTDKRGKPTPTPVPVYTPPPPPPIPLRFYGFANNSGEAKKKIFLSEGDNIFIAEEGQVIDRRFRVVKVGKNSVEIEDLLNNNTQSIPLIQS